MHTIGLLWAACALQLVEKNDFAKLSDLQLKSRWGILEMHCGKSPYNLDCILAWKNKKRWVAACTPPKV